MSPPAWTLGFSRGCKSVGTPGGSDAYPSTLADLSNYRAGHAGKRATGEARHVGCEIDHRRRIGRTLYAQGSFVARSDRQ